MNDLGGRHDDLLVSARLRGQEAMGGVATVAGLSNAATYAGLIASALELGKLIQTEQRDMEVIGSHYRIEMAKITAAFKEVEAAMQADFERDEALRTQTFDAINALIVAEQYAIAAEFHKRMIEGFSRPALETIISHRNAIAGGASSHLNLRG